MKWVFPSPVDKYKLVNLSLVTHLVESWALHACTRGWLNLDKQIPCLACFLSRILIVLWSRWSIASFALKCRVSPTFLLYSSSSYAVCSLLVFTFFLWSIMTLRVVYDYCLGENEISFGWRPIHTPLFKHESSPFSCQLSKRNGEMRVLPICKSQANLLCFSPPPSIYPSQMQRWRCINNDILAPAVPFGETWTYAR